MFFKMMSSENLPDSRNDKEFTIFECKRVDFVRVPDDQAAGTAGENPLLPAAIVDGERFFLTGNAYVLNNAGKTIDAFAFSRSP